MAKTKCPKGIDKARLLISGKESKLFNDLQQHYGNADQALSAYNRITGSQYTAIAEMSNGDPVVRNGSVIKKNGGKIAIDPKPTVASPSARGQVAPALAAIANRLERALPGVTVEFTDSQEKGSIGKNTIRLNAEKMTADTPFHELTHPIVQVVKKANPKAYLSLVKNTKAILAANPSLKSSILSKYSNRSESDQIDEAIATISGLLGADMVSDLNPMGTINENQSLWGKVEQVVSDLFKAIEGVFQAMFNLPKSSRITQLSTLRDLSAYVKDVMAGREFAPQSVMDMVRDMETEYSHPLSMTNITDLKQLLFGEATVGIDEQVRRVMVGVRDTPYGRTAFVNGQKIYREKGTTNSEMEAEIRNIISQGIDQTAELKAKLTEWINTHRMSMSQDVLKSLFGANDNGAMVSRKILSAFSRTMDLEPGTKVYFFSQIRDLPGISPEMHKYFISELTGSDPLVVVNHMEDEKMIVSLYDPTLSKTYESKSVGKLQSIWNLLSKQKSSYLQNNELGYRRLMLALTANFLMSASNGNIQVKESMVIGITDYQNQLHGIFDANMVDMVRANEDIKKLGKMKLDSGKTLADSFENIAIKDILNGNNLQVDRADYWTLLKNYWSKQDAAFLARRGLNNKERLNNGMTVHERKELVEMQLRLIKSQYTSIGTDGSYMRGDDRLQDNIEFKYLTKELQSIHNINVLDYQMNSRQRMSDFVKLMSPTHSINDERLITFKMAVRDVINRIYTKIMSQTEFLNGITKTYVDTYGDSLGSRVADRWGDALYEKSVGVITIVDENGNKHTQKINHLLWTTDESKDPMLSLFPELKSQASALPSAILKANEALCDKITEKMTDVIEHLNIIQGDSVSQMRREDAHNNLMNYTSYRKGFIPIMSKSVNSTLWSEGVKAAWDKQTGVWANHNSSYEQMTHEEMQMDKAFDSITSSFIDQLGLFGTSYTVMANPKTGAKFSLTKKQMDLLGVSLTDKGDFISSDRVANASMTTNLEMVTKNFIATMDRKIDYESHIIPLYHGVKAVLIDDRENKGSKDSQALEDWIDLYCDSVVFGRGKDIKNSPAVNKAIVGTTKIMTALTMAGNLSIGLASGFTNMWGAIAESLATNAYGQFTAANVIKASAWCMKHPQKAFQLAFHYRVANMSEHDAVNFYLNNKTKKNILSDFWVYFPNWVTDTFARSVILTAKMMHDGSFNAHSFDAEGNVVYDIKKDGRFYQGGSVKKGAQPFIDNLEQQLADQDMGSNYGYDYREQQSIRTFVAKHIIGAFDAADKAQISSYVLAKPFMMFRTYVTSKLDNMIADGQFIDEMGKWVYDEKSEMMQWERTYFEGQLRSIKTLFEIAKADGPFYKGLNPLAAIKGYEQLNETQKSNVRRMLIKGAMFAALSVVYALAVGKKDDKDDIGFVDERQFMKTFKYSYQDLLSFTWVYQTITNPSAASSMIERMFDQRYGSGWKRALNMVKPVTSVDNVYNLFTGESLLKPDKK